MGPKRNSEKVDKKSRKAINIETKIDVLRRIDRGDHIAAIEESMQLAKSTICTIRDNRDKIKATSLMVSPASSKTTCKGRSRIMFYEFPRFNERTPRLLLLRIS